MAFATSSAAFGIGGQKPAGTGLFGSSQPQTNAFGQPGGAFGQGQQQNQAGSAFGQNSFGQSQSQPAGGLFGQPQQNQQPAAGGSIFGQPQQQAATGGGLFGQPQNQQLATGGGLFGQPQQPAAGGGLFGQPQNQQAAAPSGGLFGQTSQQTGGGLFGASQQNQQPAASGSGIFGSAPLFGASKPAQPALSIFGNNNQQQQQQQQQPQSNLFGNSTNTNPLFGNSNNAGSSMFGAKPQQQLGLQASQGPPPFTKSTKFNDLPDNVKKTLEEIDSHIQGRIQISKDLHQRKLGDEATKGQEMIRGVHKDLITTTTAIRNDLHFTRDLKAKTDLTVQDTIVATRIVDGFRNPHANAAYLKDHAGFPLEFFTRVVVQMRERLAWYKSTIEQIERKLSSSAGQAQYTPHGIHATLQAQHTTFLALAAKTAAVDAQLQRIKQIYTQLWRAKTGSHRDPFEVDERADLGFGSLNM
ncbi:hypothetical protein DFH07DRAFT_957036 [Mycena maculata]|uniref:Nucleoporin nup45 n=1 Tax=Mycena maculata TaxID=230809 RepID=A0AAD7NID3_9AGAR|nr:hypothetical protein DFH07DRAFT_957036 [Mycena maculata]